MAPVDLDTSVQIASPLCVVVPDGDGVVIELPGRRVRYPASVGPALEALAAGEPLRWPCLRAGSSDDAKLGLARRWIRDGVASVHVH